MMDPIDFDRRLTVPEHVMARRIGDDSVLLDVETGFYYGLDALGAQVWDLLAAGRTLRQVCVELSPRYDVPRDRFERDVSELAASLLRSKLLVDGDAMPPSRG